MPSNVAGLHLWEVLVRYNENGTPQATTLLITTSVKSIATAESKARQYIKTQKPGWDHVNLDGISHEGTIDA